MSLKVYDKAKWHWGAENAPEDITEENGATHITFFVRWCIEKDFYSKEIYEECVDEIAAIKEGKSDCRQFFLEMFDGVFTSEELNSKGKAFANAYYSSDKTKFAKQYGYYLIDYQNFVDNLFGENNFDNAYFYVEYSEENYQKIKAVIDSRYSEYLTIKG